MARSTKKKDKQPKPAPEPAASKSAESVSGLRKAWDEWLKLVVTAVGFAAVLLAAYFLVQNEVIPKHLLAPILICGMFLIPLLDMIQKFLDYDKPKKAAFALGIVYAVLLLPAALAPVIQPMVAQPVFRTSLEEKGVELDLPPMDEGERQWILDIETDFLKDEPCQAPYTIWIGTSESHELLKGRMERKRGVHARGPKEGQEDLFDDKQVRHRFLLDMGKTAQIRLRRFDAELTSALKLELRRQFGDYRYLLFLILPLLIIGALLDLSEGLKEKFAHYTTRAGFMLGISWVFANTSLPGNVQGPVIISLFAGMCSALGMGYILPRLLRPVARKMGIGN